MSAWERTRCLPLFAGPVLPARIAGHARHRHRGIVGEEEPTVPREKIAEQRRLLVDQELGAAVVAHRDRQMHPRASRNEVRGEGDRSVRAGHLGDDETGGVAARSMQPVRGPEHALPARDERRVGTLRMMNAAIKNADIEARVRKDVQQLCARFPLYRQ